MLHEQHNMVAEIVLTADVKSEILFFSLVLYCYYSLHPLYKSCHAICDGK